MAASFRAVLTPVDALEPLPPVATWHFCRDEHGARRLAGPQEDIWRLQCDGTLAFERRLHGDSNCSGPMTRWLQDVAPPAWLLPAAGLHMAGLIDLQWHEALPLPRRVTFLQPAGTVSLTLIRAEAGQAHLVGLRSTGVLS